MVIVRGGPALAHKTGQLDGEVIGEDGQGLEGRKVLWQVGDHDLEDALGTGEVLESVLTQVPEACSASLSPGGFEQGARETGLADDRLKGPHSNLRMVRDGDRDCGVACSLLHHNVAAPSADLSKSHAVR